MLRSTKKYVKRVKILSNQKLFIERKNRKEKKPGPPEESSTSSVRFARWIFRLSEDTFYLGGEGKKREKQGALSPAMG